MNLDFSAAMRQAVQLTRAQKLMEATRVIQRALTGQREAAPPAEPPLEIPRLLAPSNVSGAADPVEPHEEPAPAASARVEDAAADEGAAERTKRPPGEVLTLLLQAILPEVGRHASPPSQESEIAAEVAAAVEPPPPAPTASARPKDAGAEEPRFERARRPLGETLTLLRRADLPGFGPHVSPAPRLRKTPAVPVPAGAAYLTRTFACAAGARDYTLYVPSRARGRTAPLIVMLHGCTQNPDDFAAGTGINRLAEEHGFIVAYPRQPTSANPSACWNWFNRKDQARDAGEPSIIAGITQSVTAEFGIDAGRIYVAGLSAGGAMAAIMGAAYPDLYAATGVHSGLACGSAADLPSAFAAMRGASNRGGTTQRRSRPRRTNGVRTIVFHGANDRTVDPSNAEAILADARAGLPGPARETRHDGVAGGRAYRRTVIADTSGVPHAEHWSIEGLGHAWSGGSPEGSFTDHCGPDASREMLRFFLATSARGERSSAASPKC